MALGTVTCTMHWVSKTGRHLAETDDREGVRGFACAVLSCPRLRACEFGDYCTIFAASLLAEQDKIRPDGMG